MITYEICMEIMDNSVKVISFDLKFESLKYVINSEFFWSKLNTMRETHSFFKFNKSVPLLNVFFMIRVCYLWLSLLDTCLFLEELFDASLLSPFLHPGLF